MTDFTVTVPASDPNRLARLNRIRLFSLALARGCILLAALLAAGLVFYWFSASPSSIAADALMPPEWLAGLGMGRRAAGFAISFVPLACLIVALMSARRCFGAFAAGNFFGRDAVKGLRDFALGLLASALLKPFSAAALSVLLSSDAPAGQHRLTLGFGSDTILALLAAGIIAVIAWVLAEAAALADENAQFI
ncbi:MULTISPECIES: DUF2975 domain-containing protein [Mesorhizobium]|jgi:hypothetical protein|uniref:DUF2975 domain-containing protein n=1 Tax=Rhizobium loti TaxID=381 RepID=A0A6M7U3D1_RHILI|nr:MULTISPECIES: DUF2975 domain-containing protein [Mesorhizobium]KRB26829.1 hypothetical protein ASE05_32190 [Mesorhizobium sp. Root172]OBQ72618.1 DUF2975 domain-containing protein [Mesorhizobium loti]QKC71774.1 DUF2975 domain-containing protein [Mesorhizobium loti]